mgnify:CR=1 FL=1
MAVSVPVAMVMVMVMVMGVVMAMFVLVVVVMAVFVLVVVVMAVFEAILVGMGVPFVLGHGVSPFRRALLVLSLYHRSRHLATFPPGCHPGKKRAGRRPARLERSYALTLKTRPFSSASTTMAAPSGTSPCRMVRATAVSMFFWTYRRTGRAPYTGE